MVAAEYQRALDVDHLVSGEHAALHRLSDSLINWLYVLAWYDAPDDGVHELVPRARFQRLDLDLSVTILAAATSLPDVLANTFCRASDRFSVSHLRPPNICIDPELPLQAVDDYLEMQLAHPVDDRLVSLGISRYLEARVLGGQFLEPDTELLLIRPRLWLNRLRYHRSREFQRFQHDRAALLANRVAGRHLLQPCNRHYLARRCLLDVFPLVGVHSHDAANSLPAALC